MILGLDVSTTCVGWTLLDDAGNLVKMGHIDFKKCNTLWEKADHVDSELLSVVQLNGAPTRVYVEESLQAFRPGLSSAATLSMLTKFNGLTSYAIRNIVGYDPLYYAASTARKVCGMKIQKTSVCGKSGKEQAFEWMIKGPLKGVTLPKTKNGTYKSFVYDEVDSYIIALAGHKQPAPPAKKKKK